MSRPAPIITLTTDFGLRDGYVGALKGVLLSRVPGVELVDLGHELDAGDIAAASRMLQAAVPFFPARSVHVAVVDPGVGSGRSILALEHPAGRFVAADNGLLSPWLDDGVAVSVDRPDLYLDTPGATFHGRDRMAPVAAALATGAAVGDLGSPLAEPARLPAPRLERSRDSVLGTVVHVDRFGNVATNIPWSWIEEMPAKICAWIGERPICRLVTHYAELPPGRPGFLCGSDGNLELALREAPLAQEWAVEVGDEVGVHAGGRPDAADGPGA